MTRDGRRTNTDSKWAGKTSEEKEPILRAKLTSLKEQIELVRSGVASLLAPLDFLVRLCMYLFRATLRHLKAWFHRWPLFLVIAFWVTVGLSALTTLFGVWAYKSATIAPSSIIDKLDHTAADHAIKKACFDSAEGIFDHLKCIWTTAGAGPNTYEAMKLALAVIGGIGGVAFLVIKYRTRASQELEEARADRRDAEAKLVAAVEQLGSESPQVRIAGVYALADVADTYPGDYKQRVVNILCGYLRTNRGKFVERGLENESDRYITEDEDIELVYISNDGAVESTILRVLADHFHDPEAKLSTFSVAPTVLWNECEIDLRGARFIVPVIFYSVRFDAAILLEGCHFRSSARFSNSKFNAPTDFSGSTFRSGVDFTDSVFNQVTHFIECTFNQVTQFTNSKFKLLVRFDKSTFRTAPTFDRSTFSRLAHEIYHEPSFDSVRGPLPLDDNGLPKGARWDDDPAPSDDETELDDSLSGGHTPSTDTPEPTAD